MDYSFIIIILIMFLDLIVIFKPQIPLLNLMLGLFTIVFSFLTYNSLIDYQPWICLLLLMLAVVGMTEAIKVLTS